MSPTSTNRSPRRRSTDVGDSDFETVNENKKIGWNASRRFHPTSNTGMLSFF
ncbi:MAG: hypothetical protein K2H92_00375 [Bacteroidaceae bacterium]|nr:hypothetical protein [Bacteroidaceae bacterium]